MNLVLNYLRKRNISWKIRTVKRFMGERDKVLDFGCGDLSLAKALKKEMSNLNITGIDVVDFKKRPKDIKVVIYNGGNLPFKSNTFDTVLSFYVFHHCDSAKNAFLECLRVSGEKLVFVESVYTNRWEIHLMKFMDWVFNIWKKESVSLPYQFLSLREWENLFKKNKLKFRKIKIKNFLFSFISAGKQYIFIIEKY